MAVGDTLLKITDYPFSYSIVGILVLWSGTNIPEEKLFFLLGAAGSIGTLLAIADPVGKYLKAALRKIFKNKKNSQFQSHPSNNFRYCIRAIDTKPIGIEIDKIVSLIYFAFILTLFSSAVILSESMATKLVLDQDNQTTICNEDCIRVILPSIAIFFMLILIFVAKKNWDKIIDHTETAGIYQLSISSPDVTIQSKDSISKPIDQNDWPTAEEWAFVIEKEIRTQRNRMQFITQAINEVYRPLYEESIQLASNFANMKASGGYGNLPANVWPQIKARPSYLLVEDEELKKELDEFYDLLKKYNTIPGGMEREINKIIAQKASEFYQRDVKSVRYWTIKQDGGHSAPALHDCVLHGKHPLERHTDYKEPDYIELELPDNKIESLREKEELKRFDEFFEIVKKEVKEKTRLEEMEKLFTEIVEKHEKLKPKIENQIKKQWPEQYQT